LHEVLEEVLGTLTQLVGLEQQTKDMLVETHQQLMQTSTLLEAEEGLVE